jgi:hypothetical protein
METSWRHALVWLVTALGLAGCSAASGTGATRGSAAGSGGVSLGGGGSGGGISIGSGGVGDGGSSATCAQAIDIVFVMDVSTSMGPFLDKLAAEMPLVDQAVKALNLATPPHYGLVVFVDDTQIVNAGQPYEDITPLQQQFTQWAQFTSQDTQVDGTTESFSMPENSLDALYRAAAEFAWRPAESTLRVVIHTTDDTFWQGPTTTPDGIGIAHDYAQTVGELEQASVRDFSFAAKLGGENETDDVSPGWFGAYQGMPSIPDSTGGSVFELDQVLANQVSLSSSIDGAVASVHCKPYPTPK